MQIVHVAVEDMPDQNKKQTKETMLEHICNNIVLLHQLCHAQICFEFNSILELMSLLFVPKFLFFNKLLSSGYKDIFLS